MTLAEVIILDQFSRNIWRDTPKAFAQDNMALILLISYKKETKMHTRKRYAFF